MRDDGIPTSSGFARGNGCSADEFSGTALRTGVFVIGSVGTLVSVSLFIYSIAFDGYVMPMRFSFSEFLLYFILSPVCRFCKPRVDILRISPI